MKKKNVLLLETVSEKAHQMLEDQTHLFVAEDPFSGGKIATQHPIHAIVTRGLGTVNPTLIEACQGLEVIARCGVGLDNIAVPFATEKGIKVINAPGSNADTVAEHTMALLLALSRNIYRNIEAVKNSDWDYRKQYQGDEIRGKKLGLIGMGNIGQKVALLAKAFGMEVKYWSRSPKMVDCCYEELDTLLAQCDVLSLHLPFTPQTSGFLNQVRLQMVKKGALLINTSRGELIDQSALTDLLVKGHLGGFAADVLAQEPPAEEELLLTLPNVLVTPHTASLTALTFDEMCVLTVQNTLDLLQGQNINQKYIYNFSL